MMNSCLSQEECNPQEKQLMNEWMHRWGRANSEAAIDLKFDFFRVPEVEGYIAYCVKVNCANVIGDPVCAPDDQSKLATAFQRYCKEKGWRYLYVITSERFAKWAIKNTCKVLMEIGEELVFNPMKNAMDGPDSRKLRNKIHHAQSLGMEVHEYISDNSKIKQAIQNVGSKWLEGRHGPQIYLGNLDFFSDPIGKRWLYVEHENEVIGMAMLSRLEAQQGWLLKFLLIVPDAPRGTSELLMMSILEQLRDEDCQFLTYGTIPKERLGEIIGLNKFSVWILTHVFSRMKWLFKLNNRKDYWKQFYPETQPTYLLFKGPNVGIREVYSLIKTMKTNF